VARTHKVYSSRVNTLDANTFVGESGRLFYTQTDIPGVAPTLRYSDGLTPGGLPIGISNQQTNFGNLVAGNVLVTGAVYSDNYNFANGASVITNVNNNIDLGNLYITDETIGGLITDRDITLSPAGSGAVSVPSLKIPVGSIISNTSAISVTIANLVLDSVVEYSTSTADNLLIGNYGLINGISGAAPGWTVYRFTTTPAPVLQVGDHLAATGMPFLSNVLFVGNVSGTDSANANIVITSQTLQGLATPPQPGAVVFTTRDTVNSGFLVTTQASADISFSPGSGGSIITGSNFLPFFDDVYDLGSPARRFRHLWMGAGTIYVLDETLGTDQTIGARDGNLYIGGGTGLTVGKFTFYGNTIAIANPAEDVQVGTMVATGNVTFNRPLRVNSPGGDNAFTVSRLGLTTIHAPVALTSTQAVFSIIGSSSGNVQPRNFANTMIQVTGQDNVPNRISFDAYGASAGQNSYVAIAARAARGTVDTPQITQAGDTIMRFTGQGWTGNNAFAGSIIRLELGAAETFNSNLSTGTRLTIQTTPVGSNVIQKTAEFYSNGLNLYGNPVSTGIRFADTTFQNTAFVPANWVSNITVGTGFTEQGTNKTGHINLFSTDVHSVVSDNYSLQVTDPTSSQNLHLSLSQELAPNSTVTFGNITVTGNINVVGNIINAVPVTVAGIRLYMGNSAVDSAGINQGGIILGNILSPDHRTLLYRSTGIHGDYWTTDIDTGFQTEHLVASDAYLSGNLFANGTAFFGGSHTGFVFANAGIQSIENVNNFAQIVNQNINPGPNASTDFVATNDAGNDLTNFVDMGINSSNYDGTPVGWTLSGPNDAYVYNVGGNLTIGTGTPGSKLSFHVGGTLAGNVVAVLSNTALAVTGNITATGNIGATYYTGSAKYLTDIPVQVNADWNNVNPASFANIRNRPDLSVYATVTQLTTNVTTLTNSINTLTANAAYQEGEISELRANITAANSAVLAYETWANTQITNLSTNWQANAAYQHTWLSNLQANIGTLNANVGAFELWSNANIGTLYLNNISTQANLGAYQTYVNANIGTDRIWLGNLQSSITTLDANVGAFELYSNANVGTIYTHINTLDANVGAYETWANSSMTAGNVAWTANAVFQNTWLSNLQANINTLNANVGAYETWANSSMTAGNVAWQANAVIQNTWLSNLQSNITTINNSITNISGNAALTFVTNAAQNIGNAKNTLLSLFGLANGVAVTTNTRYRYQIVFNANCSKAGVLSYALANTAALAQHNYTVQSNKTTTLDGYTAGITMMSFNATGSSITIANPVADTSTFIHTVIYGTIDVVTGGNVNFMVSQDQNTPVTWYILPGSYVQLYPIGPIGANTVIGTWS
jgi:hypothetical protein